MSYNIKNTRCLIPTVTYCMNSSNTLTRSKRNDGAKQGEKKQLSGEYYRRPKGTSWLAKFNKELLFAASSYAL